MESEEIEKTLDLRSDPRVAEKFSQYPDFAFKRMQEIRKLIIEAASELEEVKYLEETLKWGEPGFLSKHGSTIRIDWKEKNPDQFAIYFKCTSKLVPTFREVFSDQFEFEGNRVVVFGIKQRIPKRNVKRMLKAALNYHKVKHLPMLGM
jgi:hypothetical protein